MSEATTNTKDPRQLVDAGVSWLQQAAGTTRGQIEELARTFGDAEQVRARAKESAEAVRTRLNDGAASLRGIQD